MFYSNALILPPTKGAQLLQEVSTSNRISSQVPYPRQTAAFSLQTVELSLSSYIMMSFVTQKILGTDYLTISKCRNMSCSSRLGLSPSTFSSNFSSASKNWGFEIINGAFPAAQGDLLTSETEERQKVSRVTKAPSKDQN